MRNQMRAARQPLLLWLNKWFFFLPSDRWIPNLLSKKKRSRNNDPFFLSILNPKVALSVCNLHLRFGGGSALSYRHAWKPFLFHQMFLPMRCMAQKALRPHWLAFLSELIYASRLLVTNTPARPWPRSFLCPVPCNSRNLARIPPFFDQKASSGLCGAPCWMSSPYDWISSFTRNDPPRFRHDFCSVMWIPSMIHLSPSHKNVHERMISILCWRFSTWRDGEGNTWNVMPLAMILKQRLASSNKNFSTGFL